jgi:hemolysin activation/secretion protein
MGKIGSTRRGDSCDSKTIVNVDEIAKRRKNKDMVIPAQTGIQPFQWIMDARVHGSDNVGSFCGTIKINCLLTLLILLVSVPGWAQSQDDDVRFDIKAFEISGNTIFPQATLLEALSEYQGSGKTADDVEKARSALERYYHQNGYPTALVNIPEQTVEAGIILLEVIESKIRRVRITGNRYFTMEKILNALPTFREGKILYVPNVQTELAELNRNPDLKVAPVLMPGKELGTIDVDLKVKDKLPLHGSLELNNRNTHTTTDLRLNGMLRYDNLWQKDHAISFQFQTSPEDTDEVRLLSGSYVWPSFFGAENMSVLYGVASDSDTAFGSDFTVIGKGYIAGYREIIPLPRLGDYAHNLSVGIDYKDFDEDQQFGEDTETVPVTYVPLSLSYSSSLRGASGVTRFNTGLNLAFRGLASSESEFEYKRYNARGNYIVLGAGVEREQNLPMGLRLLAKVNGQLADQPLIANEQYTVGGMTSVHGYKESEASGDNGLLGNVVLTSPDLAGFFLSNDRLNINLKAFYDAAHVSKIDPLPGEERETKLQGTGAGIRIAWDNRFEAVVDWGMALESTADTDSGDHVVYFLTKFQF